MIKASFSAILVMLFLCGNAQAIPRGTSNTVLWPTTQTVPFGVKTRIGYGGSPTGYVNQAALGASRWLKVTSQKDSGGNNVSLFGVDDRNMLVPCLAVSSAGKCTSTYAGSWGSPATGPYTVVISEYSDAGRTVATGNSTTVTVPIDANEITIREMTSAANGCLVNCEVDNPDSDSPTQIFQFQKAVITPLVVMGDKIVWRSGNFNPTRLRFIAVTASSPYTGTGCPVAVSGMPNCIDVVSEVEDNSLDANGNLNLQNGAIIGGIQMASGDGNIAMPFLFDHLYFYTNSNSSSLGNLMSTNNTVGYGYSTIYSRFESGCSVTDSPNYFSVNNSSIADHDHFIACPWTSNPSAVGGIAIGMSGGPGTVTNSVFENLNGDAIDLFDGPFTVTNNLMFNWSVNDPLSHPDSQQFDGVEDGGSYPLGTSAYNFSVLGNEYPNGGGPQGFAFVQNNGGTLHNGIWTSATFNNNISWSTAANASAYNNTNNILHTVNTEFSLTGIIPSDGASIETPQCVNCTGTSGGTNATFTQNATNSLTYALQQGVVTATDNKIIAYSNNPAIYTGCFPNYVGGGGNTMLTNRAAIITFSTPAASAAGSGCRASDGTYPGALTPADSTGHACWNVVGLTAFDTTKTCAAQGLTQAS